MKIKICIGSSCHIKGSRQVVETFQDLAAKHGLSDKVEMSGTFCMGNCKNDVSVSIGTEVFSVSPDTVDSFFDTEILPRLNG